jgi:hypothetical protein
MATNNLLIFKVGLNRFVQSQIKPQLTQALCVVADEIIRVIEASFEPTSTPPQSGDGNVDFPVYTANLRDATGIGVYCDGVLMAYRPNAIAQKKQNGKFGYQFLEEALQKGQHTYNTGVWIVLFSATPYALSINLKGSKWGRGVGFFDSLKDELISQVSAAINSGIKVITIPIGFDI